MSRKKKKEKETSNEELDIIEEQLASFSKVAEKLQNTFLSLIKSVESLETRLNAIEDVINDTTSSEEESEKN